VKSLPALDAGWMPVRAKKTLQNKTSASVLIQSEANMR
jgi:hypothetical protein